MRWQYDDKRLWSPLQRTPSSPWQPNCCCLLSSNLRAALSLSQLFLCHVVVPVPAGVDPIFDRVSVCQTFKSSTCMHRCFCVKIFPSKFLATHLLYFLFLILVFVKHWVGIISGKEWNWKQKRRLGGSIEFCNTQSDRAG